MDCPSYITFKCELDKGVRGEPRFVYERTTTPHCKSANSHSVADYARNPSAEPGSYQRADKPTTYVDVENLTKLIEQMRQQDNAPFHSFGSGSDSLDQKI